MTGRPYDSPTEIRARLVEQVTAAVRWEDSMRFLLAEGFTRFVEFGPGTALSGFMKRIDRNARVLSVGDVGGLETTIQILAA